MSRTMPSSRSQNALSTRELVTFRYFYLFSVPPQNNICRWVVYTYICSWFERTSREIERVCAEKRGCACRFCFACLCVCVCVCGFDRMTKYGSLTLTQCEDMIFLVAIAQLILTLATLYLSWWIASNPRDVSYTLVIGPYLLQDSQNKKVSDDMWWRQSAVPHFPCQSSIHIILG